MLLGICGQRGCKRISNNIYFVDVTQKGLILIDDQHKLTLDDGERESTIDIWQEKDVSLRGKYGEYNVSRDGQWLTWVDGNYTFLFRYDNNVSLLGNIVGGIYQMNDITREGNMLTSYKREPTHFNTILLKENRLEQGSSYLIDDSDPPCLTTAKINDDSSFIVYANTIGEIRLYDTTSQTNQLLYKSNDHLHAMEFDWDPENQKEIIFSDSSDKHHNAEVYRLNIDTKSVINLTNTEQISEIAPAYYENTHKIVFLSYDHQVKDSTLKLETLDMITLERVTIMRVNLNSSDVIDSE